VLHEPKDEGLEKPKVAEPVEPRPPAPREHRSPPARIVITPNGEMELKALHRAVLTALAQHPKGLSKNLILLHAGYRSSGGVSAAFAALQRGMLVEPNGAGGVRITDAGKTALGDYQPLPVGSALLEWLYSGNKLSKLEKALLRAICDAGQPIAKGVILERAGYKSSGGVSAAFARLVRFGYAKSVGAGKLEMAKELSDDEAYETA
jgi:hypothetical protein